MAKQQRPTDTPRKAPTRSPEYEEARLKKELRVAKEQHAKAEESAKIASHNRIAKISALQDELAQLQSRMAENAQTTLL